MNFILNITFLLTFLGGSLIGISQEILRKFVLDKIEKTTIPYANIYIKNGNKGWVSDGNGSFEISTKQVKTSDTLVFSAIGYKKTLITFGDFKDSSFVFMSSKAFTLNEVKIKTRRYKRGYLGKRRKASGSFSHGIRNIVNTITNEEAIYIPNSIGASGIINDIRLFVYQGSKTPVKIQLYNHDVIKGEPSTPLLKEPLLIKEESDRIWTVISLKYENIPIPANGFYISINWGVDSIYYNTQEDTLIRTVHYTNEPPNKTRQDTIISKGLVLGEAYTKECNKWTRYQESHFYENNRWHNSYESALEYSIKHQPEKAADLIDRHNRSLKQTLPIYATILYDKSSKKHQEDIFDNNGIVPQKLVKKILKKKYKKVKKNTIEYSQSDVISLFKSIKKAEDSRQISYSLQHLYFYSFEELEEILNTDIISKHIQSHFLNEIITNPNKITLTEIESGLYSFEFDQRIYGNLQLLNGEWKLSPTINILETEI